MLLPVGSHLKALVISLLCITVMTVSLKYVDLWCVCRVIQVLMVLKERLEPPGQKYDFHKSHFHH